MKIVAIGGGEIGRPGHPIETEAIDREIIRLTGKKNPKALLIPTASGDSPLYWATFQKYYGNRLRCKTDVLHLVVSAHTRQEIQRRILAADIIYVGGGNTLRMMKIWRKCGIDRTLRKAGRKGVVLAGVSAGAICWFKYGNSDSMKFGPKKSDKLIRIRGTGFLPFMVCPHYNVERSRRPSLRKMIKQKGGLAIALDNCAALEVVDDKYRVIISSKKACAYRLFRHRGKANEEALKTDGNFRLLTELSRQKRTTKR